MVDVKNILKSIQGIRKNLGIADAALLVEGLVLDDSQVMMLDDLMMSIAAQINNGESCYIDCTFDEEQ